MTATETIQAASIARVTDKSTGKFAGWTVKSNHTNDYYRVHCFQITGECLWTCTCKAGQHNFVNCKPDTDGNKFCCHVKAIQEVESAKQAARKAAKVAAQAPRFTCNHWKKHNSKNEYAPDGGCWWCANPPVEVAQAEMRKAAFQRVCAEIRAIEARYKAERRYQELEQQRAEAQKIGGWSLLKPAA